MRLDRLLRDDQMAGDLRVGQTAFVTVTSLGLLAGRVPGLLTAPTDGLWVAERLIWLPVFAITLSVLWLAFRRAERG
jgi:hypothetical protein